MKNDDGVILLKKFKFITIFSFILEMDELVGNFFQ